MAQLILSFGRPLDIYFRGCKYRIEGRNNLIETGLLTRPSYNAKEIEFLQQAAINGGVAVDIGCNIGLYALPLARATGPSGQVLAVDANSDMIERIAFNARASEFKNLKAIYVAVGAEEARVDLRIRQNDVAIVSVERNKNGKTMMLPLLRILAENGVKSVDSLKIDIEGHEDVAMVPFLRDASESLLPSRIVIERASATED
ncbi:MAG: FkbM family methyltransferase [Sulfitobacter sp.]